VAKIEGVGGWQTGTSEHMRELVRAACLGYALVVDIGCIAEDAATPCAPLRLACHPTVCRMHEHRHSKRDGAPVLQLWAEAVGVRTLQNLSYGDECMSLCLHKLTILHGSQVNVHEVGAAMMQASRTLQSTCGRIVGSHT
jgi:hypothetical protein